MSLPDAPFGRLLTAMATPFKADGSVDLDGVAKLADYLMSHGHNGIAVSGTTGESPTTTTEEDGETLRVVIEAVAGRGKVVAGVGTNSTAHSIELAQQAAKVGADGILLVTPYYNKPAQPAVEAHFRTVAESAGLPVMLYDVPGRTGTTVSLPVYENLANHELMVAVKDAVGDMPRVSRLAKLGYAVYSGDDIVLPAFLAHGACGLVSVAAHVAGNELASVIADFPMDPAKALATYQRVLPAIDAIMGVPNYGATTAKGALQLLGVLDNRRVRQPLLELDEAEYAALREGLTVAGLL